VAVVNKRLLLQVLAVRRVQPFGMHRQSQCISYLGSNDLRGFSSNKVRTPFAEWRVS